MDTLPLTLSFRYLFAKKSHNAINIISGIAVGGIAVATVAMVVVMSVFNGFHELLEGLYTEFDPIIKVTPAKGKYFSATQADQLATTISRHPDVEALSRTVEDNALILFRGHPQVVTVKGVDEQFPKVSNIKHIVYGDGQYQLSRADLDFAIPGIGLGQMMGGPRFPHLQICAPRGGERINLMDPLESLSVVEVDNTGLVFSVNQRKYDDNYLLVSLPLAQQLFEKEGQCTAMELALRPSASVARVKQDLASPHIKLQDRMEQQESVFGIMQIEKLLAYIFLTFILLVACFNIVSSVSMLIIEKSDDVRTLSHLGMTDASLRRIFMLQGQMITLIGTLIGIIFGSVLCLVQEWFGIIQLGNGENFIVQAYPVSVHPVDLVVILLTALVVGFLATWYPVRHFTK